MANNLCKDKYTGKVSASGTSSGTSDVSSSASITSRPGTNSASMRSDHKEQTNLEVLKIELLASIKTEMTVLFQREVTKVITNEIEGVKSELRSVKLELANNTAALRSESKLQFRMWRWGGCPREAAGPLHHNGSAIFIFPDYPPSVTRARSAFNDVFGDERERYGLLYPARLRITHNGKEKIFEDPAEATMYVEVFGVSWLHSGLDEPLAGMSQRTYASLRPDDGHSRTHSDLHHERCVVLQTAQSRHPQEHKQIQQQPLEGARSVLYSTYTFNSVSYLITWSYGVIYGLWL